MIKLIQFPPAFGLPNPSPSCMKVEILLKMAGLAYTIESASNPGKGPKGKLPAIEDDGALVGNSELIRWHLERKYGVDFDKGLGDAERAWPRSGLTPCCSTAAGSRTGTGRF